MKVFILMGGSIDDWSFYGAYRDREGAEKAMDELLKTKGFMAEITDAIVQ